MTNKKGGVVLFRSSAFYLEALPLPLNKSEDGVNIAGENRQEERNAAASEPK